MTSYLILGSGMAGLSVGSLLAKDGHEVKVIEKHYTHGGYAHTFKMREFEFCAQIHYIWGCKPGEPVFELYNGLGKDVKFNQLNPDGYDHISIPGKRIKLPSSFEQLEKNLINEFPSDENGIKQFINILKNIRLEIKNLPEKFTFKEIIKGFQKFPYLIKYRNYTLQNVFDKCKLSKEVQMVLNGQAIDFLAPPKELSIMAFQGLFCGYTEGAYYPDKHFKFAVDTLANTINENKDSNIIYEKEVVGFNIKDKKVESVIVEDVKTKEKEILTADIIICNMDPKMTADMIGENHFPIKFKKQLDYDYSLSAFVMYLGVKDLDLKKYGFGNYNIWHVEDDLNNTFKDLLNNGWKYPYIYLATPTLHSRDKSNAPENCHIIEAGTVADFNFWNNLKKNNPKEYILEKNKMQNKIIDLIEQHYIPDLRKHIVLNIAGSPTTNVHFCNAPKGNAYGSHLTPKNITKNRLTEKSPFTNFYWCNASAGFGGFHGTIATGIKLYEKLTNNKILDGPDPDFRKNAKKLSFLKSYFRI